MATLFQRVELKGEWESEELQKEWAEEEWRAEHPMDPSSPLI